MGGAGGGVGGGGFCVASRSRGSKKLSQKGARNTNQPALPFFQLSTGLHANCNNIEMK